MICGMNLQRVINRRKWRKKRNCKGIQQRSSHSQHNWSERLYRDRYLSLWRL